MKNVRLTLQILLPIVILACGGLGMRKLASLRTEPETRAPEVHVPIVETVAAVRETERVAVTARGTVEPRAETRLMAEVTGRVTWVSRALTNGGYFAAGDELARIDDADYRLALTEARLAVAQAELRLAQEQADADVARREWERLGSETPPSPLTLREPQVAEATAALEAAEARVARAQRDVGRCTLVAPYGGRVRSEHVDVGQLATPGAELATIYATDAAEVRLLLADSDLAFLDLGLGASIPDGAGPPVTLSTEFAGRRREWRARITRTEGELDPETRMVAAVATVDAPFAVDGPDDVPLAPGMFVDARIEGGDLDAVRLPRAAVRGADAVLVVKAGTISVRAIDVLRATRDAIYVRAGVEPGERVVVSPLANAVDGMRVRSTARDAAPGEKG